MSHRSRQTRSALTIPRRILNRWLSWWLIGALLVSLLPESTVRAVAVTGQTHLTDQVSTFPTSSPIEMTLDAPTDTLQPCGPAAEPEDPPTLYLPLITRDGSSSSSIVASTDAVSSSAQPSAPMIPNVAAVAPSLDPTVVTDFAVATEFLYTGNNPIQTGVAADAIDPRTVAVVRGCIRDQRDRPLPGVRVNVVGRPELGSTLTGLDGQYNFAVNGGGTLTLNYAKAGKLPAQRTMALPLRNYVWADIVVLIALDAAATTLNLAAPGMQLAQGSVISDTDGIRQAALLVPQGTQASMVMADGTTRPLPAITVRATEYTVGDQGLAAMPGTLPPQSGYTYAVEYSVDQAITAGATDVRFNQPIYHYVENFLDFPAGTPVPAGYYDRQQAKWVPAPSGKVIRLLTIAAGLAELDTDGDNLPDNDPALGITIAERQRLATLYSTGQSLWRVPLTHFSAWDFNWPFGPPAGAVPPPSGPGNSPVPEGPPCPSPNKKCGSIIETENQTLRERIEIVGTPFTLNYRNEYTPDRVANNTIRIPVSDAAIPSSLKRIDLEVTAGGRLFKQSFEALPNQTTLFTWDGNDGYGRRVLGKQLIRVRVGYTYAGSYQRTDRFGYNGNGIPISGDPTRQEVTLWRDWYVPAGTWDARGLGLGGWMLSAQHVHDSVGDTIYFGHGAVRSVNPTVSIIIDRFAGLNGRGDTGDGGPARDADLRSPDALAVAANGSLYVGTLHRIRKIDPDGIISTVVGTGSFGFSGDGGPATAARVNNVGAIALAADGSLYFTDKSNNRIRRVDANGIITTIAGNGERANAGDGGPATQAALYDPLGLVMAPDGTLYVGVAERKIRKIDPEGIVSTVFDGSSGAIPGITQTFNGVANDLHLDASGNLYFQNSFGAQVFSLGTDGIIRAISEAGGLSRQNGRFTIDPDGQIYVGYRFGTGGRIYRVNPDTTLTPIAGKSRNAGALGDGGPPLSAEFVAIGGGMAFAPDRSLYVAEYFAGRIRIIRSPLPRYTATSSFIPAEDGSEVYIFDATGRHERTLHPLTGATLLQFGYDPAGLLVTITDGDGDVTRIEREGAGTPTAIVAHDGQRTPLALDANGFLAQVTNPAGETTRFGYTTGGLLTSMTDTRGSTATYRYDADGLLISATDRAGATKMLTRTGTGADLSVQYADPLARATTYSLASSADAETRVVLLPDGTRRQTTYLPDGTQQVLLPNGMAQILGEAGDPRFGMMAPIVASSTLSTPSGLRYEATFSRTVTLAGPTQSLSLTTQIDTTTINGRTFTDSYDAATRTFTLNSPLGRIGQTTIDAQGRITQAATPGIATTSYSYDARGRLVGITQGSGAEVRNIALSYNSAGYLATITDALDRVTSFTYDAAGRVTQQSDPGGHVTAFAYDANGNLTGLTPPGRTAHSFSYTPTDLNATYTAPALSSGDATQTTYSYNAAQELTQITEPGGRTLSLAYDSAGRVATHTTARGTTTYSYSPTTGQLTGIAAPGGVGLSYTYDGGLLTGVAQSGGVAGQVGYSYDNDFRVASTSVNSGNTVNFSYDADGLLTGVGALSLTRNAQNGLLTGSTLSSTTESWDYNSFAEPVGYQANAGATALYAVSYTRDKLGRITEKVETIGGASTTYAYSYDASGRLVEVRRNGAPGEQYSYDPNSNRLSAIVGGVTSNGVYDAQDRLLTYGGQSFTYLPSGELRTRVQGGQTTTYDYDVQGNLVGVALPDGRQVSYLIDGQNRRVGKLVDGAPVQGLLYESQLRPIAEVDGAGNLTSRFVYATGVNIPDYMVKDGATYRLLTDQVGSVRLVIDAATGAVAQRLDYGAFGNVTQDTNPGFQPFGFAGGLYDRDTGLVRFGARDYDPVVGRWTAKDPIGFAGGDGNLYGYAFSDPLNYTDPTGEIAPAIALGAAILGGVGIRVAAGAIMRALARSLAGAATRTAARGLASQMSRDEEKQGDESEEKDNDCTENIPADPLDDYPANPDSWQPPEGWKEETRASDETNGRHRHWKGPNGELRRWDANGSNHQPGLGPHWHDHRWPNKHTLPNR